MASDITKQGVVTVTDEATLILKANRQDPIPYLIRNKSTTQSVYVGDSNVTVDDGYPVDPGREYTIPVGAALYGICASGQSAEVRTLAVRS